MHDNLVNTRSAPNTVLGEPSASARILPFPTSLLPPLVVDLDGTLIRTDLLLESICKLMKQNPLALFALPLWLLKGRAYLKRKIAQRVELAPALLPYRTDLVDYLRAEHEKGPSAVAHRGFSKASRLATPRFPGIAMARGRRLPPLPPSLRLATNA